MTDDLVKRLRAAFDADDVPTKNIAMRLAADEIEQLRHDRYVLASWLRGALMVLKSLRIDTKEPSEALDLIFKREKKVKCQTNIISSLNRVDL